ncbi:MAG TPA: DUF4307 domain-containing protein [Dermatophilaceae bacterium]|nr:DUF4307 domain-containing protein [Dermatophilaceae bacterium]
MRIPRPAPGKGKHWLLATLALVAASAMAVWWGLAATLTKPTWQTVAFSSQGNQGILLKFEVRRPEGMAVRCQLLAKELGHAVVGTAEVLLPAELGRDVTQTHLIRTTSEAVAAEVRSCREV